MPLYPGLMYVRGALTTSGTSISNGASVGTFGTGYYNTTYLQTVACQQTGGAAANNGSLRLEISTSGAVSLFGISTSGPIIIHFQGFIVIG
jgi:hypothetical protein